MLTDALFNPPHASGRSSPSGGALLRRSETEARSAFTPLTLRPSFSQSAGVWTQDRRSVSCISIQRGGGDTEAVFASAFFSAAAQTCRDWKSSSHCCLVIVDVDMWSAASQRDHGWCEKTSGSSPLTSCSGGTQRTRELKRPRTTRLRGQKWIQRNLSLIRTPAGGGPAPDRSSVYWLLRRCRGDRGSPGFCQRRWYQDDG